MAITAVTLNHGIEQLMIQRKETRAEVMVHLWTCLSKNLVSMLGLPAFASVYESNLYRTRSTFPSLRKDHQGLYDLTFSDLKSAIEGMSEQDAADSSTDMMRAFIILLNSLVGENVTISILVQCWGNEFVELLDKGN